MSVLQKAFTFVTSPMQEPDINAFLDYVEPLSHEGVPGEKRWLTLRGVSTTTAYVRVLSEMMKVHLSPGGTHRVSLKGLALQLVHLATIRARPTWAFDDDGHQLVAMQNYGLVGNFISLLMWLHQANQDQTVTVLWAKGQDYETLIAYAKMLDGNYEEQSFTNNPRQRLESYLTLSTYGRVTFKEDVE